MKKIINLSAIIAFSSMLFITTSCKKNKETTVDNETQSVVDNAICEQEFMRIAPEVNNKGAGSPKAAGFKVAAACGDWVCLGASGASTIIPANDTTINTQGAFKNGPVTYIVPYNAVCSIADGVIRTGTMTILSTGKWNTLDADSGYVKISFNNYSVNGIVYTGTITVTKPSQGVVRTVVTNGRCTKGTWTIDYACDKTITIDEIAGTASIYGSSNGKNREGKTFTTTIAQSTPIIKKRTCKWITSGVLELTPEGFKTRTVDFGNGTCDNDATYTVNGQTVAFKMD